MLRKWHGSRGMGAPHVWGHAGARLYYRFANRCPGISPVERTGHAVADFGGEGSCANDKADTGKNHVMPFVDGRQSSNPRSGR